MVTHSDPLADKSDFDAIFCMIRTIKPINPDTHMSFKLPENAMPQITKQVMKESTYRNFAP